MIYLFNNRDELIKIISREEIIDFTRKTEINSFDEAEFELDLKYDVEVLNQARYFGFFIYNDIFKMFKITTKNLEKDRVIKGLDRAESDLNTVKIIKDRRLTNVTADQALTVALEDTGYEIGEVVDLPNVDKINYYYISPREALVKIIETFHCEFDVRYTFVNNKITSRYVDLFNKQGRKTGKQFYHGQDLLNIKSEEDDDKVITALIGRGKGEETDTGGFGRRIEFTDIVWEKSKGKPINKPAGQNYIVNEDAKAEFGLFQNGELRHRWGVFVDENIEDKEILLQKTYEELKRLSIPLTVYTASLVELGSDLKKGDTVAIIRDDLKIAFQARIHTLKIDMLNSERSTVELGDYETLKSKNNAANPTNQILAKVLDKQGQDIEAFNQRIEEEKRVKNAELDDRFRTVQLNIDNALEQAKSKAEVVKAEINSDIQSKLSPIQIDVQNFKRDFQNDLSTARNELLSLKNRQVDTSALDNRIEVIKNGLERSMRLVENANNDNRATIIQLQNGINELNQTSTATKERLTHTESDIRRLSVEVSSRVNQSDFDTIKQRLISSETLLRQTASTLETKATKTDFDTLKQKVSNAETSIRQATDSIQLKANQSDLNSLDHRLNDATAQIRLTASAIEQKVNRSELNDLTGRVGTVESSIRQTVDRINLEVSKIPREIGGRNLIWFKESIWSYGEYNSQWEIDGYLIKTRLNTNYRFLTMAQNHLQGGFDGIRTFSGYIKVNNKIPIVCPILDINSEFGNIISSNFDSQTGYFSITQNVGKFWINIMHARTVDLKAGDEVSIEYPKLERGSIATDWSLAYEDTENEIQSVRTRIEQTADSIRQSVSELSANAIKQSDVSITSSGIVMRSGITDPKKSVGDLAAASFRINPYQIDLFAEKIRVKGDMLVDGAITSRKIASGSIDTAQLRAGAVTATILNTNAVTADKLRVDEALFNKLSAGEVLAQKLFAKSAFITSVQSVDLSANRITSGMLRARNGAVNFNLDSGQLNFYTDAPALRRVVQGYPNQFIAFKTGTYDNKPCGVTLIGSNRDEVENTNSGSFAGIRIWNSKDADQTDVIGDIIHLSSNPNDDSDGWRVDTLHYKLNIQPRRPQDYRSSQITAGDFVFINSDGRRYSLRQLFKDLFHNTQEFGNRTGGFNNVFTNSAPD